MKSKLQLAIIATILPVILQAFINKFSASLSDGFGHGFRDALYFLLTFCPLGTLPFFIALYKSKEFNALMEKEAPASDSKDENWIKHVLLRVGIILGICLAFLGISLIGRSLDAGYLAAYGIAATIGIFFLVLTIEAILLARKKLWNKFYCNIAIIGVLFYFGINLL